MAVSGRYRVQRAASRIPRPFLSMLAFMMALGPFDDTEYTPSMPAIAQSLNVDYSMAQLTMASYPVGMATSEVFYSPLVDRFGRRPVTFVGAGILTAGALICLASFGFWPLIGGHLVQGVGACAGGVITKARRAMRSPATNANAFTPNSTPRSRSRSARSRAVS